MAPQDATDSLVGSSAVLALATALESRIPPQLPPCEKEASSCVASTVFCAVSAPALDLGAYLRRIVQYFGCSRECFVAASIYIDRLLKANPKFAVTPLNVHRLLLTGAVLGAKFHDDDYYSNAWYAQVGGLSNKELNHLEAEFLRLIDWRVYVSEEDFERYHVLLRSVGEQGLEKAMSMCVDVKAKLDVAASRPEVVERTVGAYTTLKRQLPQRPVDRRRGACRRVLVRAF